MFPWQNLKGAASDVCLQDAMDSPIRPAQSSRLKVNGTHRWKGAASDVFLLEAVRLMQGKGYSMGNIDITIIAEKPKISPHKQKILDNLYAILKTPAETINIKVCLAPPPLHACECNRNRSIC